MEHTLSILPFTTALCLVLLVSLLLRFIKQPSVVAYIVVGILLGSDGLGIFSDKHLLIQLGSLGVLFLLFFVGMEVSLQGLLKSWKIALIGTSLQVALSVGILWLIGSFLDWPVARKVALGFVISLSSTAVVMKLLQESRELNTDTGRDVVSVLLVQDLLIVPMLIVLGFLGGESPGIKTLFLQGVGAIAILSIIYVIIVQQQIRIPFLRSLHEEQDHELEVIVALCLCFTLAVLTELCHLSSALGAFIAGMIVSAAKETEWVHASLEPFRIVFVGIFFVSIGMLIDLSFLATHPYKIAFLVTAVLILNTLVNALIFRALGDSLRDSFYAGALLAQIGELSFLVTAVGLRTGILNEFSYQTTIAVIAITLLISPLWIWTVKQLSRRFV